MSIKQDWIKALRSGEYKQGIGNLRADDTYCCLGVLACVKGVQLDEDYDHNEVFKDYDRPEYWFVPDVWLPYDVQQYLQQRNDGWSNFHPHSFEEIADIIETKLDDELNWIK